MAKTLPLLLSDTVHRLMVRSVSKRAVLEDCSVVLTEERTRIMVRTPAGLEPAPAGLLGDLIAAETVLGEEAVAAFFEEAPPEDAAPPPLTTVDPPDLEPGGPSGDGDEDDGDDDPDQPADPLAGEDDLDPADPVG